MHGEVGGGLEEKEDHEYWQGRFDPENREANDHECPEEDRQVHRDDPEIGADEGVVDVLFAPAFPLPVVQERVQVVEKKDPAGEPDPGLCDRDQPEHPAVDDEVIVREVKDAVVDEKYPGKGSPGAS
jgi:hypothetical protein